MSPRRAFLSLVQYSPDPLRAEAINLGLVLLDPESGEVRVQSVDDFGRAKRVFPWANVDTWWLGQSIAGVRASLIQLNKSRVLMDEQGLRSFAESLGGEVRLTEPRPVPFNDFDWAVQEAFDRLVHVPESEAANVPASYLPVAKPLNDAFTQLRSTLKNVGFDRAFPIGESGLTVRSDYDYRNGTANLVKLLKVGAARPGHALREAVELGGQSVQVGKHLVIDGLKSRLLVVLTPVAYTARVNKIEHEIQRLSSDYPDAEYITSETIPDFAKRVLQEAK